MLETLTLMLTSNKDEDQPALPTKVSRSVDIASCLLDFLYFKQLFFPDPKLKYRVYFSAILNAVDVRDGYE